MRDVERAFSGVNLSHRQYLWTSQVEIRGDQIRVQGVVLKRTGSGNRQIGRFVRHLFYADKAARAKHDIMEIDDAEQDRRTAYYHYRKLIRFYDRIGIRSVEMIAAKMGPERWPQFGFDIAKRTHKERLRRILKDLGYSPLPADAMALFAPDVAFTRAQRDPIGLRGLRQLAEKVDEVPMRLDLSDRRQRRVLRERGIL